MKHFVDVRLLTSTLALLPLLLIQPFAHAMVMTFDGLPDGSILSGDYTENGIKMSVLSHHYDFVGEKVQIDTYPTAGPNTIKFELSDGGLFYLERLAVTFIPILYATPNYAEYTLRFSDGSSKALDPVDGEIVLDASAGLPTSALTWFTYTISHPLQSSGYYQYNTRLDNITLIPEPTTFALLGLGSLALVMARRRS